ncbi:MAG: hemerythrin domain-containing protein [Acidobacteriota bacterium]|jgi:hemerythrin-like domain-containing protein
MITITDALRGEHAVIYRLLSHVESACDDGDLDRTRTLAGELEAALEAHARIEDELLFRDLDGVLPPQGPLAVMRAEHEQIEGLLASFPDLSDAGEACRRVRRLTAVARDHFAKEEQVLFPMAERMLPPARLRELGERWAAECGVAIPAAPACG